MPILVAFFLAACASHSPEEEAAAEAAAAAKDTAKCQAYGFQPDTPDFDKCLTKLADQRRQVENVDRAARLEGRPPSWGNF
jgi:hypothetical protein